MTSFLPKNSSCSRFYVLSRNLFSRQGKVSERFGTRTLLHQPHHPPIHPSMHACKGAFIYDRSETSVPQQHHQQSVYGRIRPAPPPLGRRCCGLIKHLKFFKTKIYTQRLQQWVKKYCHDTATKILYAHTRSASPKKLEIQHVCVYIYSYRSSLKYVAIAPTGR